MLQGWAASPCRPGGTFLSAPHDEFMTLESIIVPAQRRPWPSHRAGHAGFQEDQFSQQRGNHRLSSLPRFHLLLPENLEETKHFKDKREGNVVYVSLRALTSCNPRESFLEGGKLHTPVLLLWRRVTEGSESRVTAEPHPCV